jgi:hypothetical protein
MKPTPRSGDEAHAAQPVIDAWWQDQARGRRAAP